MITCPLHLLISTCDIQRPVDTVDAGGSPIETYGAHLSSIRCRIQPASGSESNRYGEMVNEVTHHVYVDGAEDVLAKDRVKYGSQYFDIQGVVNFDQCGTLLRLDCVETKP